MSIGYVHHRLRARPRAWKTVADAVVAAQAATLAQAGGLLYGVWRSQIGRPRDELTAITAWPGTDSPAPDSAGLFAGIADLVAEESRPMLPTLRPADARPPRRQGNYAFRWFETPAADYEEFLSLCAGAWPGFEAAYDSQVIGLWRFDGGTADPVHSLLLTRRPDLAMWERSKLPAGAREAAVRRALSRRYDLCTDTVVHTATLLTAGDREDTARWA